MINTLIDNARKFTERNGSVTLSASVVKEGYVDIMIADTGQGMSEEERAHLFERKVINSSSAEVQTSHGFGLLNCKGIIDKYKKVSRIFDGCTISVESEKDKGSVFSLGCQEWCARCLPCWLWAPVCRFMPQHPPTVYKAIAAKFSIVYRPTPRRKVVKTRQRLCR